MYDKEKREDEQKVNFIKNFDEPIIIAKKLCYNGMYLKKKKNVE